MGKRGVACTVCAHERRHQIEIGLVHRVPSRVLAKRFELSHHSVLRHARNHLTPQLRAALLAAQKPTEIDLDALRVSESEGLLSQLVAQRARLQSHGELALDLGDVRGCVAVEGAITNNLALVGKLLGMLATHHNVTHTSILISSDYLRLRATLLAALRPFPDAARAVGAALHAIEAEAAQDITARAGKPPVLIEHAPSQHQCDAPAAPPPRPIPPPPC